MVIVTSEGRRPAMTALPSEGTLLVRLPGRALTLDDVAALSAADENHRYELDGGNLSVLTPADTTHNAIITKLIVWLVSHGHSEERVQPNSGVRIRDDDTGRTPDLIVLHSPPGDTVWVDPADICLVVEVVSPSTAKVDRMVKPGEYAAAGIEHFWRIERDGGKPTAHLYTLGVDECGQRAYVGHKAVLLDELLRGEPPTLK
jgi:Uma2 family endonuclease